MGLSYVLDTNIALYWLADNLLDPLPGGPLCISVITELEILSFPFADDSEERGVRSFLDTLEIVPLSEPVKRATIDLRRARQLKLPDAVIAGTALALGMELLSNDAKMHSVPGLRCSRSRLKKEKE